LSSLLLWCLAWFMPSTALGSLDFAPWMLDVWNAREASVIFRRICVVRLPACL